MRFSSFNSENWEAIALCDHTFFYFLFVRYICPRFGKKVSFLVLKPQLKNYSMIDFKKKSVF